MSLSASGTGPSPSQHGSDSPQSPTVFDAPLQQPNSNGKRNLPTGRRAMSYPRKRAVTACQSCRARKTKCDNQRPICGFCLGSGGDCHYEDRSDHSSFDPATLELLSRLNHIVDQQASVLGIVRNIDTSLLRNVNSATIPPKSPTVEVSSSDIGPSHLGGEIEPATPISTFTTPDTVLSWPIFGGRFPPDCLQKSLFTSYNIGANNASLNVTRDKPSRRTPGFGFQEEEVLALVENFLSSVHTKNPILDEKYLKDQADIVAENGLSWDAPSCLILLVCALGALARPFEEARENVSHDLRDYQRPQSLVDKPRLDKAEAYYSLARRRIGLLGYSILASQCHFLSGVYLMYCLRPIEAFQGFHQASMAYQVCTKWTQLSQSDLATSKLEQRLYWSCFKSECELLSEIALPRSGIVDYESPQTFPSPPEPNSPVATPASLSSASPSWRQDNGLAREQEQTWFYYLSEIALRRIGNRVLESFFSKEPQYWLTIPISSMIKVADEFNRQLDQWQERLPPALSYAFTIGEMPREELPYMISARVLEIRSWISRPFLYYVIHSDTNGYKEVLAPKVQQALECAVKFIHKNAIRHRHHGTWYTCRTSATAAFLILASAKKGLEMPEAWMNVVRISIQTLEYWEKEGPGDMRLAREIMEDLLVSCQSRA